MESDTAAHVSPFLRDSSDSGPLWIDLAPSDSSEGASTSTSDARPARLEEIADELKADDVPCATDDMMNALTSAMPELRGSLAARARSLLAAGRALPLGAMLRSLARYTARGAHPGNQIADRSTRSEDPSQSTLKRTEEKQPPELSYLLTPSPRCEQSSSNLGLVSFTTLPNTPASSKCDPASDTELRPTSPNKPPTEQLDNPGSQNNITQQQNTLPNYFDYIKKFQHVVSTNQIPTTPKIDNPENVEKELVTNCQLDTKKHTETQNEEHALVANNNEDTKMEIEKDSDDGPKKANDKDTEMDIDDVFIVGDTTPDIVDLTALDSPDVDTTAMKFEPISQSNQDSTIMQLTIQDDDDDDLDDMFRTVSDVTSAHTQTLINDMDEIDDFLPAVIMPKPIPTKFVPLKQEPIEAKPGRARLDPEPARAGVRARKRGRRGARTPRGPRGPRMTFETPRPVFQELANGLFAPAAGNSFPYPSRAVSPTLFDLPKENDGEEEEEDEEEMGVAETYAPYRPAYSQNWCVHPDPVVETASLSSVEAADMTYALSLPADTVGRGLLSGVQLEAVVSAGRAHGHRLPGDWRAGFLIGDGAGVGKGRTIAGIIFENYLKGRKRAVWVSVSNDLKYDAERDLRDIGAGDLIPVHSLNKMSYGSLSSPPNGASEGVVFSTYASLIASAGAAGASFPSRLAQLRDWCGPKFDGCIVFDECHRAKNLRPVTATNPSKTGLAVLELQMSLPDARLVYASATGASEPKNMAYMVRLGIWGEGTPFPTFNDFLQVVERRGVGAMEIVAMDMKLRGMYIARQLSFHGVTFKIEEVPLSEAFREAYDKAVALWVVALGMFQSGLELVNPPQRWRKIVWAQFWGAHQRFFKYMCIAAKVSATVERAEEAVRGGRCVVIGLQATGEARTRDQLAREHCRGGEFVCSARGVFQNLVEKQFPDPDFMKDEDAPPAPAAVRDRAAEMKEDLLLRISELAGCLPPNALDDLVHRLGGPAHVAEMTGRKNRVVKNNGRVVYESRSESDAPLEILNLTEKQRFMDGEKVVAIISEAASSGISLQSDKRVKNQKQRVHITLELPWSADRAIQQFGRTHRSNQANAPEYIFLISDLAGERRFASTVAKRLESLGALTHGDRRATETRDLSQFNIENKFGRYALKHVQRAVSGSEAPLVAPPEDYPGNFLRDAAAALADVGVNLDHDNETVDIQRFLNRLLGVPVRLQNALFRYFSDTFVYIVNQAKRSGRFDLGILDLGSAGERVRTVRTVRFLRAHATGRAPVSLHTVRSERGMTWEAALQKQAECSEPGEGFYLSRAQFNQQRNAVLCCASGVGAGRNRGYILYRPNVGRVARAEPLSELIRSYEPAATGAAERAWRAQHAAALRVCSHRYWRGGCAAPHCEVGLRVRTYHVLSGSVLAVWARVEAALARLRLRHRLQVVRVRTEQGDKIVGTLLPKSCVEPLIEDLKTDSLEFSDHQF